MARCSPMISIEGVSRENRFAFGDLPDGSTTPRSTVGARRYARCKPPDASGPTAPGRSGRGVRIWPTTPGQTPPSGACHFTSMIPPGGRSCHRHDPSEGAEVRATGEDHPPSQSFHADLEDALEAVDRVERQGLNVYVGVSPRVRRRGWKEDVGSVRVLRLDVDQRIWRRPENRSSESRSRPRCSRPPVAGFTPTGPQASRWTARTRKPAMNCRASRVLTLSGSLSAKLQDSAPPCVSRSDLVLVCCRRLREASYGACVAHSEIRRTPSSKRPQQCSTTSPGSSWSSETFSLAARVRSPSKST